MAGNGIQPQLKAIFNAGVKGCSKLMGGDGEFTVITISAKREIISELIEIPQERMVDSLDDRILAESGQATHLTEVRMDNTKRRADEEPLHRLNAGLDLQALERTAKLEAIARSG